MVLVAVHCGAGNYSIKNEPLYRKLCKRACQQASDCLRNSGSAIDACEIALKKNSSLTNAGYGSNLTLTGRVECEASIMDGSNCSFGACGSLKLVRNPISLARVICDNQTVPLSGQRVQPQLLVGPGAEFYARRNKVAMLKTNRSLITKKQKARHKMHKSLFLSDTIGAICIDEHGNVAAGSSSGGIQLKCPGRIGHCANYGSGIWAENKSDMAIGICTSGCGEYLVRTQLARSLACDLFAADNFSESLMRFVNDEFFRSPYLKHIDQKLIGLIAIQKCSASDRFELVWAHSSPAMAIGWSFVDRTQTASPAPAQTKAIVSRLFDQSLVGKKVVVNGHIF